MSTPTEYEVFDADFHYYEGTEELVEYFPEPWKTRFRDGEGYSISTFYPNFTGDKRLGGRIQRDTHPAPMDVADIEDGLDTLEIEKALLLSDFTLAMQGMNAMDERSVALANASVDYMLEKVVDASAGRYSAIPIPHQHPESAVELVDRVCDEDGFVGVYMVTGGTEPPLGNEKYDPIYEKAQKEGLPVVFHSAASGLDDFHTDGFEKFLSTHSLGFMEANMEQITSLVVQGVPEKFPDLEFLFLESGLFWVPTIMQRLDTEYMSRQSEAPLLNKRPSKYIKEHFYFGTQPLERPSDPSHLEHVVELVGGPERIIYASDYPHWDFDHPNTITELPFLSESEKQLILSRNATELFGL